MSFPDVKFEDLKGRTMKSVEQVDDEIHFHDVDGSVYKLIPIEDCCNQVSVEDICGDLADLAGSPITIADESSNSVDGGKEHDESFTWTFYRLYTAKGGATIRFYGSSNGYYSESVNFVQVEGPDAPKETAGEKLERLRIVDELVAIGRPIEEVTQKTFETVPTANPTLDAELIADLKADLTKAKFTGEVLFFSTEIPADYKRSDLLLICSPSTSAGLPSLIAGIRLAPDHYAPDAALYLVAKVHLRAAKTTFQPQEVLVKPEGA